MKLHGELSIILEETKMQMHKTRIAQILDQPNKASRAIHAQFDQPFLKITMFDIEIQKYYHHH